MPQFPPGLRAALCVLLVSLACCALGADVTNSGSDKLRGPITCIKQKTPIDCDLLDDCVWCEKPGSKVGTGCYPLSAAKLLPKSWGVSCDKELSPTGSSAGGHQQEQQQQAGAGGLAGTCDNKPEAACVAPQCIWCTSAAVGGGCYTPEEAKLLPKAIFKCKTAPAAS